MPPVATGVAACSADLIAALGPEHEIDVFVDESVAREAPGTRSAHDFVWLNHRRPYDLVIYQVGNSSHHDYQWPYLFRYPGLAVLHDAHLHHARAALLLRSFRAADYRAEFAANHPEANADLAELAVAGFDNHLHYDWPMTLLVVKASRMVAVHTPIIAERLRAEVPDARIEAIHLGHGKALSAPDLAAAREAVRARYGIPRDAIVFGCYGGLSPEKRLPQVLSALHATRAYIPSAHLLLAGAVPSHYDLRADVERHGLADCTTMTGYLSTEDELTACIAACDVALTLRWPTAREVSGPWLRCLAAGKPTVIIDLEHLAVVPSLDPRTWQPNAVAGVNGSGPVQPCAVAIDIADEDHSLRMAMRRLAADSALRGALGAAAEGYWLANHSPAVMADDYRRLIADAGRAPAPSPGLPRHLAGDASGALERILRPFGLASPLAPRRPAHAAGVDADHFPSSGSRGKL